ncbi:MAG: patatin-like phospholipase family protein [Alphaproteobacteria bacterium]|nr:patatin-like phospholipase family protein [Alphaproteobacteria bacterium]MBU1560102.1 patatin-like phospholipase family protein [Alphaproteobacteria bacterium]MBU2302614.1 patatin-like phospholipase family protein [Alphaproteobacteria bacterium]MBU2367602.1 patatin-like phospholipase family protein [Alphaproteobacteria bacterium]
MAKPTIALALGSGAARGWSHIGVIDVLTEAGIVPYIVCGTSMGALVGSVYASGRLDALRDWAMGADWRAVAAMVDLNVTAGGLVDGANIVKWLSDLGLAGRIEDLKVPFTAVATDISSGREIWLQSGPLAPAIRASIGMPGVFSPTRIDGRWLADGGLVNPVPVSPCRAMGADYIIAVNLNDDLLGRPVLAEPPPVPVQLPKPESLMDLIRSIPASVQARMSALHFFGANNQTPSYFDVLTNSIDIMQDHITRSRLAGEPPHAMIMPVVNLIGLMDFHRAAEAIAEGRAAAERALPALDAMLSGRKRR